MSHAGRVLPQPDPGGCDRLVGYSDQAFGLVAKERIGSLDNAGSAATVVVEDQHTAPGTRRGEKNAMAAFVGMERSQSR